MKINQIIPTNSLDSFRLPKSPLIDKNINPIEDSPNFDASPSSFFPKTTNNDRNLPPIHQNSDSLETDSFQSPANNKNNYNSKFYYQYFKKMVDESQKEQNSQEINTFDEEENEYTEEKIENLYEELINKPFPEENFNLYVTKRPIFDLLTLYSDPYPLLTIRKQTLFIKYSVTFLCGKIINAKLFETLSLMIILWNTMMLFMDDPYSTNDVGNMFDTYFQSFYTIEMSLKIFALGFIWNEGSYLRIGWNILDFFIVVTGFMPYVMDSNNMRFSGLRILRVLRPLKTISSLPHLKMILSSLFNAFPMIMNAVFLLFFCLLIYAITALQLLMGSLKKRCFNQQTGLLVTQYFDISYSGFLCGFSDCPDPSLNICGKQLDSPNGSISNFDTVFWSLLMMFQNITLENWSVNMYYVARTFNYYMVFFFISLAFVGAMILFNLLASIISQAYEEQSKNFNLEKTVKDLETKKETAVGLEEIKQLKFCEKYHHKRMDRRKNILKDYGVTDNHVFVPKADDLRWQDILDLKLQKMETKKIKPIEAHNEMQELIKDLDEVFPLRKDNNENDTITNDNKNNLGIKTPPRKHQQYTDFDINFKDNSNDGISPNIKSELKLHFMGMKINETDHNTLAPIYENTQNNIFTLNSPEEKNLVVKNELSLKKTEKYDKKSTKFERIIQNSLSLSSHKKNSFTSPQNIGSPDDKNLEEYSSSISSKAFLKIRTLGKLLKSRTVSLFQKKPKLNIKIIDYMLMVDFSKIYESDSLNDVLVDVITERKLWAQRQLELKLNDFKCNVEYKTNDIDTKELFSKNVKKQTMIMTNLPGMGKPEKRMKNPLLLKQLLYGKNMKKYENSTKHNKNVHNKNTIIIGSVLRIPILGCSNYFLQIKWKKQMKKMKIPDFNGNNSLLKTNNKRRKIKKRIIKKEKTRIFHYKELKNLVKQTLNENYDHEEVAKEFNFENEYMEIKKNDYSHKLKMDFLIAVPVNLHWSGEDVYDFKLRLKNIISVDKTQARITKILNALTTKNQDFLIWLPYFSGLLILSRKNLILLIQSKCFENVFLLAVIVNTIVLSLFGSLTSPEEITTLDSMNKNLTYVFIFEMGVKILGYGIIGYAKIPINLFDGAIVVASIFDLITTSASSNISAIRAIRILRVLRILRPLHYMKKIIRVFSKNFFSFIYICLLLVLLIVIYTLIGAQLYAGQLDNHKTHIRQSFDSIYLSFLCVFQLVSVENWNDIETITLNSELGAVLTVLYLLSLIILGNYVFLNLFLGVLLEGFSENDQNFDELDPNSEEAYKIKIEVEKKKQKEKEKIDFNEKRYLTFDSDDWDQMTTINSYNSLKSQSIFFGVECEDSLWFFKKTSTFRIFCYQLAYFPAFEYFILFLIFCNSVKLGLDTYIPTNDTSGLSTISTNFDIFFNVCFIFEALTKIIAFGFFFDEGSYLRNSWNILDFLIVSASLLDMSLSSINLTYLKIFRLLRVLRMVSHNPNMKMVVLALFQSVGPLINLIILVFFILLIFAIMGVTLMSGTFGYCSSMDNYYNVNKNQCIGSGNIWSIFQPNFDNIINAMTAVFILSTQEGWTNIMYFAMDGNTEDIGPNYGTSKNIGFYFVIALTILNFFLMNMFVGVLCNQFVEAKENASPERNYFISSQQKKWINYQSLIFKTNYAKPQVKTPQNKFRAIIFKMVKHQIFDIFLMICIVSNIISLGLNYEGAPASYDADLEKVNYFFTGVFMVEFLLKIISFGPKFYFASNWNKFDFVVVFCSFAEIVITNSISESVSFLRVGPQIIRIFRVIRVTRIFKLVRKFQSLTKLIETLISALPSIANVGALYLLVYYIFAILGVFLYEDIAYGVEIDELNNFHNVWYSFLLCFRMVTGENWWVFMYDCSLTLPNCIPGKTCGSAYAPFYFISLQIVQAFIIQSLFILVILQSLDDNEENPEISFKKLLKDFRYKWNEYTYKTFHKKINSQDLIPFFKDLHKDLGKYTLIAKIKIITKKKGFSELTVQQIGVEIMKMNLESDINNQICFHEVLFGSMKRVFGNTIYDHLKPETADYLTKIEIKSRLKLKKLRDKNYKKNNGNGFIWGLTRKIATESQIESEMIILKAKQRKKKFNANPLERMLILGMIWKSWSSYTKKTKEDGGFDKMDIDSSIEELRD